MAPEQDPAKVGDLAEKIVSSPSFGLDQRLIKIECSPNPLVRFSPKLPRSIERIQDKLRAVLKECLGGIRPWPLYISGPAGTGKTCAGLAVCDVVRGSIYVTEPDWCDRLNREIRSDNGPADLWDKISSASLTVLDEMGARERPSEARWESILRFADRREWQSAIYISNLSTDEFRTLYGERIYDRVMCGTAFELAGSSRR